MAVSNSLQRLKPLHKLTVFHDEMPNFVKRCKLLDAANGLSLELDSPDFNKTARCLVLVGLFGFFVFQTTKQKRRVLTVSCDLCTESSFTMVPMRVPDVFLEKLLCDVCSKFLSVPPVKVYPGKKIKCGRCSNNGPDDGVVSLYELIANQFCFPCVNRYDGCDELLTLSQVAAHEKKCQSKCLACPICEDNEEIPTFLMTKHFREKHREAFLKTPNFSIDLKESPQTKWFMYELKNKLFFINCSMNGPNDTVFLNATYIGVPSIIEKITQKFVVYCGSITTEKRMCLPHHYRRGNLESRVNMTDLNHGDLIIISFQIDICRNILSEMPVIKPAQGCTTLVSAPLLSSNPVVGRNSALLLEFEGKFSEMDFVRARSISLDDVFRKTYHFTVDPTSNFCVDIQRNYQRVFLRCLKCCEYEYSTFIPNGVSYVNMFSTSKEAYPMCFPCSKSINIYESKYYYVHTSVFTMMHLICIFCNSVILLDNILEHEATCSHQPNRLCPLESCSMKGKVIDIHKHFQQHSPEYCFSFKSFAKLNLVSKSPLKQFLMARNAFVYVELKWNEPQWHVKISLCGEKVTFAGMKLKAILIDVASGQFLGYVKQSRVRKFRHMETVQIKCFFEEINTKNAH